MYGKSEKERSKLIDNAQLAEKLGAKMILLECVSSAVVEELKSLLEVPIIGIGSGERCDGQIIVSYDLLGISFNKLPKFSQKEYVCRPELEKCVKKYIKNVRKISNK